MRKLILILALLTATLTFAQSPYPEQFLGARPGAFSARGLSLGHCLLTSEAGPASLMGNPATLVNQRTKWRLELNGDVSRVKESRKYPYYDAFEGVLGYNNYAINDHLYSRLDGGAALRMPTAVFDALVLSVGSYSAYRFDYTYHEEVRDRYTSGGVQDLKLGQNRYDINGDLRSLSLGAAAKSGDLAIGCSVNALYGKWDYERGVYYADSLAAEDAGLTDLRYVDRGWYRANNFPVETNVGAMINVSQRLALGARAVIPGGEFEINQSVVDNSYSTMIDSATFASSSVNVRYPKRFGGGLQYRPQGEFRPLLLLEGDWITYSDVQDNWDDTFELRAGAEQEIVPGAPVRLGFVYGSAPQDKDRATTLFTAGIGFTLQKLHGDFGVELGKLNYTNADLFPQWLYGDTNRSDADHVETALFRGMISLRYEL